MILCSWTDGSWATGTWAEHSWDCGVPTPPAPAVLDARAGGGGIVFRYVDALDDDALLISLLSLWMNR